ncbi:uncharacterized protein LOC114976956 [Acropora millepora]|uniref:uncharacterized protein LOC114976956 n=1 Tax=Acropora millepora TaxID=45264 RepID=UPI001CF1DE62|nr:uncharacterized protein LOC114976956 [Acropora millepora]
MMFSLPAMKFIIGCFFLGVIIVAIARAEESYLEDLSDEVLNDRPPLKKPNARAAVERLFECLRENHGELARACKKEFIRNIPKRMKRLFPCAKKALDECTDRPPKNGNVFFHCIDGVEKCLQAVEGVEGST